MTDLLPALNDLQEGGLPRTRADRCMMASPTDATQSLRYSVIVPAFNAEATLGACLRSLLDQSIAPETYEVLVVDDGSTDGTAEVAARFPVMVWRQDHAGPAAARNAGARAARGEYLLFTDADCEPIRTWMRSLVTPLERFAAVGGVKGGYASRQSSLVARFTQLEFDVKSTWLRRHRFIDFIDTSSAAIRRRAFEALGGFDERFTSASNEDTLLSYGLVAHGWQIVLQEDAVVYHRHPETVGQYLWRKVRHGYWRIRVYEQHPDKLLGDSYTPRSLQAQFVAATLTVATLPWSRLRPIAILSGLVFLLATVPFARHAARSDYVLAVMTPMLLFFRSLALGAGLVSGLVAAGLAAIKRRRG